MPVISPETARHSINLALFLAIVGGVTMNTTLARADDNPYAVPREDFSIRALSEGYTAEQAYHLASEWSLQKFLEITESGAFSYMNLAEFMPTAVIRRDGPVATLETDLDASIGETAVEGEAGTTTSLDEMIFAEDSTVQGVMVLHEGRIVYETYPGMRPMDNHVWMSNAKIMASLVIGQLEDEGLIDVQNTIGSYVEGTRGTAWEDVTVFDVLNMQSGLDLEENPATRSGDTPYGRFVRAEVGVPNEAGEIQTHNEALFAIPYMRQPGEAFEYSSANTQMLGLVIEAVTNQRLAEALTDRVWSRAGMTGDATLALSPQGNGIIHGLISSRLIDMAKTGLLYTPSWNLTASERVVSDAMIERIQTTGMPDNYLQGTLGPHLSEEFREQPMSNAYQWDAVFADGDFYKSGMNGQGLYVSPERDVVIVWYATGGAAIPMEAYARAIATAFE